MRCRVVGSLRFQGGLLVGVKERCLLKGTWEGQLLNGARLERRVYWKVRLLKGVREEHLLDGARTSRLFGAGGGGGDQWMWLCSVEVVPVDVVVLS